MTTDLNKKIAVVTGGSHGLGLEIVKLLLEKGCVVHIAGRNKEQLETVKSSINSSNLFIHTCDVTDVSSLEKLASEVSNTDILVNNAGVWIHGTLLENDYGKISNSIDINLKGVIYTTKAFLPYMLKNNKGFILNVSSTSGLTPRPNHAVYAAEKYGVRGFSESLELELKDTNIKVAAFYPGGMNTGFHAKDNDPIDTSNWMDPKEVAKVVVFMLEQSGNMVLNQVVASRKN